MLMLLANTIAMALHLPTEPDTSPRNSAVRHVEDAATLTFTVELALRVVAHGLLWPEDTAYLRSLWSILDACVVLVGWLSILGMGSSSTLAPLRLVRLLRPLRSLKLVPGMKAPNTTPWCRGYSCVFDHISISVWSSCMSQR